MRYGANENIKLDNNLQRDIYFLKYLTIKYDVTNLQSMSIRTMSVNTSIIPIKITYLKRSR